jgi:hypothetical protein
VLVIGAAVILGGLVLAVLATSVGMRRNRAEWHRDAKRLLQDGLVILDLAESSGAGSKPYGLETLMEVADRLDRFLHNAGPIRTNAPSIRTKEVVENLCHSGSTFAAAVTADRILRTGVTAKSAQQQALSTQRVMERRHEFDLNLREFSWQLDEWP